MMSRDTVCDLCERVVPRDEVDSHRCEGCGAVVRDEPYGEHAPEDHIGPDDAEDEEGPLEER
jgi:hypothetical protein